MDYPHFISTDDGYTESGFIAAVPGQNGDFRFTYRPMVPAQSEKATDAIVTLSGEKYTQAQAEQTLSQIVSWDGGKQITLANLLRLRSALYRRMCNIIAGFTASDIDPKWSDQKKQAVASVAAKAVTTGKLPGDIAGDDAAKNLLPE